MVAIGILDIQFGGISTTNIVATVWIIVVPASVVVIVVVILAVIPVGFKFMKGGTSICIGGLGSDDNGGRPGLINCAFGSASDGASGFVCGIGRVRHDNVEKSERHVRDGIDA